MPVDFSELNLTEEEIKEIKQDIKEKNLFKFFNKESKKMFLVFKKTKVIIYFNSRKSTIKGRWSL